MKEAFIPYCCNDKYKQWGPGPKYKQWGPDPPNFSSTIASETDYFTTAHKVTTNCSEYSIIIIIIIMTVIRKTGQRLSANIDCSN